VIQVSTLYKSYFLEDREIPVLNSISMEIGRGEYVSVMGPSGAGKSTLLNVIGCLDRADSGQYLLAGQDVSDLEDVKLAAIRKNKIGFVFQSFQFIDYLDLLDNVSLPGFYGENSRNSCRERALRLLEQVGLENRISHRPSQLSGGECQRAAVARALFNEPEILLADEPTGNLDSNNSEQLVDLFSRLHSAGLTILLITHNPEVAASAERCLFMRDGQLYETKSAA
jgi:putative ABC transport system ATP-binding protein